MRKQIAVLASHAGTVLQAIIDGSAGGKLAADVCLIISNNSGSGAALRAEKPWRGAASVGDASNRVSAAATAAAAESRLATLIRVAPFGRSNGCPAAQRAGSP